MFEDKKIYIMSYTLETVIAEKFETCVRRNTLNTRMKDYYDLYKINMIEVDSDILFKSVRNTFRKRETRFDIDYLKQTMDDIKNSDELRGKWLDYVGNTPYAKDIPYEDVVTSIEKIVQMLEEQFIEV